jgi:hypothetical protein
VTRNGSRGSVGTTAGVGVAVVAGSGGAAGPRTRGVGVGRSTPASSNSLKWVVRATTVWCARSTTDGSRIRVPPITKKSESEPSSIPSRPFGS